MQEHGLKSQKLAAQFQKDHKKEFDQLDEDEAKQKGKLKRVEVLASTPDAEDTAQMAAIDLGNQNAESKFKKDHAKEFERLENEKYQEKLGHARREADLIVKKNQMIRDRTETCAEKIFGAETVNSYQKELGAHAARLTLDMIVNKGGQLITNYFNKPDKYMMRLLLMAKHMDELREFVNSDPSNQEYVNQFAHASIHQAKNIKKFISRNKSDSAVAASQELLEPLMHDQQYLCKNTNLAGECKQLTVLIHDIIRENNNYLTNEKMEKDEEGFSTNQKIVGGAGGLALAGTILWYFYPSSTNATQQESVDN